MKHLKKIAAALLALLIITGICACKTAEHIIAEEIISQNETVSVPDEDNISTDENTENGELKNSEEDLTESNTVDNSETEEIEENGQSPAESTQVTEEETVEETVSEQENESQEEQTENNSVTEDQETKEEEK
ncbi:MAG: hypothetical protein J5816_04175 [Clostridia bacterium]|nr:hypothetical protein [Clostridia bacterium]